MTNANWLSILSLLISGGTALVLLVGRHSIAAWISKRIQHHFDLSPHLTRPAPRAAQPALQHPYWEIPPARPNEGRHVQLPAIDVFADALHAVAGPPGAPNHNAPT